MNFRILSACLAILMFFVLISCSTSRDKKIKCYAWLGGPGNATDQELESKFNDLKNKGIDGLMYSGGQDAGVYQRVGKIARKAGLEFHTWIPTLVQGNNPLLKPEWYAVNGLGETALEKPAYVDHYKFLCPNREEVYQFLSGMYGRIADLPEVDGIHLDFIRFPDVILARGLWKKYGLVMDREFPQFDYCYCDKCVGDFKTKTGIDIRSVKDPSQVEDWKQFRYDLITHLVNRLSAMTHSKGKQLTAAVFPGPSLSKKLVRQEWNKWEADAFYPMNYNDFYLEGTPWIGDMCKEAVSALKNRHPVYSGLFICPDPQKKALEPDPENHGLLPEELEPAIRESIENGAAGICLFTPERMTPEHWKIFKKAIHTQYAIK